MAALQDLRALHVGQPDDVGQQVLLKDPRILLLDEATSHLDTVPSSSSRRR